MTEITIPAEALYALIEDLRADDHDEIADRVAELLPLVPYCAPEDARRDVLYRVRAEDRQGDEFEALGWRVNSADDLPWRLEASGRAYVWFSDADITVMRPAHEPTAVPATPGHPTELSTLEDYENAPEGTVAAITVAGSITWTKGAGGMWRGDEDAQASSFELRHHSRKVLRWGWGK